MPLVRRLPFALLLIGAVVSGAAGISGTPSPFQPVSGNELENAYRVTDKVISGAAPEGDAAFRKLCDLGVKTIISVDGAKPDVALAHKHGLRYVHLPIGYDDVAPDDGLAIARAIDELPGPIYVHCHHGQHRSAAAVAVACVINGRLRPEQAESVLKTFGTGENYKGLWASARAARPADRGALGAVKVDYVETAKIPPLAEAMVQIDQTLDRLKLASTSNWAMPPEHPDVDAAHEALQLMEHFHELGRTEEIRDHRPQPFRDEMARGEQAARALHDGLSAWVNASGPRRGEPPASVDAAFKAVTTSCTACHKAYRD